VELQYVEVSSTSLGKNLQPGWLQVYGRMGECASAHTFIELTEGPRWLADGPALLDAKALQTELLTIRGDFQEVTVRAIGTLSPPPATPKPCSLHKTRLLLQIQQF
jgi:hypothetical protein